MAFTETIVLPLSRERRYLMPRVSLNAARAARRSRFISLPPAHVAGHARRTCSAMNLVRVSTASHGTSTMVRPNSR